MTDTDTRPGAGQDVTEPNPPRSRLKKILNEYPEARPAVRRAIVSLLATALATIAIIGLLLIWHLKRRGDLIRGRLVPPRDVSLPYPPDDAENAAARPDPS